MQWKCPGRLSLSQEDAASIFDRALQKKASVADARAFTAHMLMEMARMSVEDGLVMQLHPGSARNHNHDVFERFGPDQGADIPLPTEYTRNLSALLNRVRKRARIHPRSLHPRRNNLLARARPAGWPLPRRASRTAVVVPRQHRRHVAVQATGDRDGGLLQHGGLQRRYACLSVDSGAARSGPACRCAVPGRPRLAPRPARRRSRARDRRARGRTRPQDVTNWIPARANDRIFEAVRSRTRACGNRSSRHARARAPPFRT